MKISKKPYLSIIIPTHNRARLLKNLLKNLELLKSEADIEVIVVDNNSKDETESVVKQSGEYVCYVFEPNTSFTRARMTGAQHARGDVLVYLDDDVIVHPGSLAHIAQVFSQNADCGVAGGKILPLFEVEPPAWVFDLQKSFNGLSLYDLGDREKTVDAIPGPLMAIRKDVFFQVGGFPPDTIGVETNTQNKTFKKLYLGPGDYGLCLLIRKAGFKVVYSPHIKIQHIIPPIRLTKEFWLSRMIGEGHCAAMSKRHMPGYPTQSNSFCVKQFLKHGVRAKIARITKKSVPLLPDEMWAAYYLSLIKMERVLGKNPKLSEYIWKLGYEGVSDNNFDAVLTMLPQAYQDLAL